MSEEMQKTQPVQLPTLAELFSDDLELAGKSEALNVILNTPPPEKWIRVHPFIKQKGPDGKEIPYRFLPIDKVEFLLRRIFKKYKIRIKNQGTAFNGVWVTVRVKYFDPSISEWMYQDGIGSIELQTKKGTAPTDLANINHGALSMAFPLAKTLAIKDACDLIGNIFGANLNRRDTLGFTADPNIIEAWQTERYAKAINDD